MNAFLCCSNSVRHLILMLSFLILSSLFANLMIYNLVAIHYEQLLLPAHFSGLRLKVLPDARTEDDYKKIFSSPTLSSNLKSKKHMTRNKRHLKDYKTTKLSALSGSDAVAEKSYFAKAIKFNNLTQNGNIFDDNIVKNESESSEAVEFREIVIGETALDNTSNNINIGIDNSESYTIRPHSSKFLRSIASSINSLPEKVFKGVNKELPSKKFKASTKSITVTKTLENESTTVFKAKINSNDFSTQSPNLTLSIAQNVVNPRLSKLINNKSGNNVASKSSVTQQEIYYMYNSLDLLAQSLLFTAPGFGILVGHFPATFSLRRFSAKRTIALALLISGFLTAGFPFLAAEWGHWSIVAMRFMLGICFSPALAFIGTNASHWGKVSEQLFFVTFCLGAIQLSLIVSWRVSLELLDLTSHGLAQVFGIHAAVSAILSILWLVFYEDTPQKHFFVNGLELNKIMTGKTFQSNRFVEQDIFPLLMKSASTWVIWLSSFGYFFAFAVLVNFLPIYTFKVLQQNVNSKIVIPFISLFVVHIFAYFISGLMKSSTLKVRIFNTLAFVICAIGFLTLAVFPPDDFFAQKTSWILWVCLAPLGFVTGGFIESSIVYGRLFSQFIVSNLQMSFGSALVIAPLIVFFFTVENSIRYWRLVFFCVAVILALSAAVFAVLGRGQPSSWARPSWNPSANQKMSSLSPMDNCDDCGIIEMRTLEEFLNDHPHSLLLGSGAANLRNTSAFR